VTPGQEKPRVRQPGELHRDKDSAPTKPLQLLASVSHEPHTTARGTAGDCCVLCGRVGVDLLVEHSCRPNLTAEQEAELLAAAAQPRRSWDELLAGACE
jgi:hypothetical protein